MTQKSFTPSSSSDMKSLDDCFGEPPVALPGTVAVAAPAGTGACAVWVMRLRVAEFGPAADDVVCVLVVPLTNAVNSFTLPLTA